MKKTLLFLGLLSSIMTYGQIPTNNLQRKYLFTGGSFANELNPGNGDLINTGTASQKTADQRGKADNALILNGDYFDGGLYSGNAGNVALSFWIRTNRNDAKVRYIASTQTSGAAGYFSTAIQNGKVFFDAQYRITSTNRVIGSTYKSLLSTININDNQWHHVVVMATHTALGSNRGYDLSIYIDGVARGTASTNRFRGGINILHGGRSKLSIGIKKDPVQGDKYIDVLDDFLFYDRTLSPEEIQNLHTIGLCKSTGVTAKAKNITLTLDDNGNASLTAKQVNDGSTDSCGRLISNLGLDKTTFGCSDVGTPKTVTLTATDDEGNTKTTTAEVTVKYEVKTKGNTPIVVELGANGTATIQPSDIDDGTASACGNLTLTLDKTDFTCTDAGKTITVTLTATDANGHKATGTTTVKVEDKIKPTASSKNITVQLDATTNKATITPAMVNNVSTDNCASTLTLAVSKSEFTCQDLGENTVTLTATDASGNAATATAKVTVTSFIKDETVTTPSTTTCPDGTSQASSTISTGGSITGINYFLRNSADNSVVDGPKEGTGNAITFSTGNLTKTTRFNVYAEPKTGGTEKGQALDFDGINDHIVADVNSSFDYNTAYSMEAWVKAPLPGTSAHRPIFHIGTTQVSDIEVYVQKSTNKLIVVHNRGKSSGLGGFAFPAPPNNVWFHLAVSFDGSKAKVYYDGVEQNTTTGATPPGPLTKTNGVKTRIGTITNSAFGNNSYFKGQLDDLRVWSTTRSASEIKDNMNKCLRGNETGLKAYYNFDQGTGTTATDLTNGNHGTLTNMDANTDWVVGTDLTCARACGIQMSTEITIGDNVAPTAIAKNISVQQDGKGNVSIKASDLNNGSSDNCSAAKNLTFSLDKSEFTCADRGDNTVILTVKDESGNTATATATVTITSAVTNQTVTAIAPKICPGESTTIRIAGSQTDVNYFLRNVANEIVAGPVKGTGAAMEFSTGTLNKNSTFNVYGEPIVTKDEAVKLAGTSTGAFVSIPSSNSLQLNENWTLEAWVKPTGTTLNIIETYDRNGGFILRTNGTKWQAYAMVTSTSFSTVTSVDNVKLNEWTHIAATFNETTDELKIYINGVLNATNSRATVDQRGSKVSIKIGARGDDGKRQGGHSQDEVRIWNVERSAEEIKNNMSKFLTGKEQGLVAYLDFNDLTFTAKDMVIPDRTNNGNNGTITGTYTAENIVSGSLSNSIVGCGLQMATAIDITAEDKDTPTARAKNITVRLDANNSATVSVNDVNNGSSDTCGSVTLSLAIKGSEGKGGETISFTETNIGDNTVVLTVTDQHGNISTAEGTVTVNPHKASQTITFENLADKVYGDASFALMATASSGLTVNFAISAGPATLSGNTLSITGTGTITVRASQEGNEDYAAASPVEQTFTVNKASLTVSADDKAITFGDQIPDLTVSYSGFVKEENASTLTTIPTASTSAENGSNAGTYAIVVSGGMAANYTFTYVSGTLTINKADQVITIQPIDDKKTDDDPFDVQASVDSGLPLTYEINGPATLSGATVTLNGTEGAITITVTQAGDENRNAATASVSFAVSLVTSINDELDSRFGIFPNPAHNILHIEHFKEVSRIKIMSLEGQILLDKFPQASIDVSGLKSGIYLLQLTVADSIVIKRFIKK